MTYAKLNVFIKLIVLATCLVEENVPFWLFSLTLQTQVVCHEMPLPMKEPQKDFDNQSTPDAEKFCSLIYQIAYDGLRWQLILARQTEMRSKKLDNLVRKVQINHGLLSIYK